MKKTKEIGGKLLKYAEETLQNRAPETSKKIKKYVDISRELYYASNLMAGHKSIMKYVDISKELYYASNLMAGHKKIMVSES